MHRRPRTGMDLEVDQVIRAADLRAGRCFQGLQPLTAAGGRKNDYPGECRAFPQGTPAHFKVHGTGISSDADCHPGWPGVVGLFIDPVLPAGRTPLPPGSAGPRLQPGAAPQRGDKAHGRLEGGRRRLGLVMRSRRAAHVAGSHIGGACDLEGSGERIDMGWHHRVWRGTALGGAGGWCGSRPLTAALWHRGQRTQRPACL